MKQKRDYRLYSGYGVYHSDSESKEKIDREDQEFVKEHSDLINTTVGFLRSNVAGVVTRLYTKKQYGWSFGWATVKCFQKGKAPHIKECSIRSLYKIEEYVIDIKRELSTAEENLIILNDYYNTP
jgi:hypothetical protein